MKKSVLYYLIISMLLLTGACSGGSDGEGSTTASQSVTIQAEASTMQVSLDKLSDAIETATAVDGWLSVTVVPYTSGSPVVKLNATSNPDTGERRTKVIIITYSQTKMELTVIQKGQASAPSDHDPIEDAHDVVTDQPAYAPIRE